MTVFYVVFGLGLRQGDSGFVVFLLTGLIFWRWFDASVKQCSSSIVSFRGLIGQVYLPKVLLPMVPFLANSFRFLIVLTMLAVVLVGSSMASLETWWWSLPLIICQALLTLSIGFFLAALIPLIPDLKRFVDYGMTLLFFMSAIFYRIEHIDPEKYFYFMFNPMAFFIESQRMVLIRGEQPDTQFLIAYGVLSLILMAMSVAVLKRFDKVYPKLV